MVLQEKKSPWLSGTKMLILLFLAVASTLQAAPADSVARHQLFSPELRILRPSPVYDFLEQALADHQAKRPDRELPLRQVIFTVGSWNTLLQVRTDDDCQITNIDNKRYAVSWSRNGTDLVALHFPIDYELLANSTRRKMELALSERLQAFAADPLLPAVQSPLADDSIGSASQPLENIGYGIYVQRGQQFPLISDFTADIFYTLTDSTDTVSADTLSLPRYQLLIDDQRPAPTLANWLLAPMQTQARINVELLLSDYSSVKVDLTIPQWQAFCRAEGCTTYYAYEATSDSLAKAVLMVDNTPSGYFHMVEVDCPLSQLQSETPQVNGRVYLYIPTANISALFGKAPEKRSKNE